MKISQMFPKALIVAIVGLCLGVLPAAQAGDAAKKSKDTVKTNEVSDELPIPLSVFDVSLKPTKDPFFPLSTRQPFPKAVTNAPPSVTASSFVLKGVDWSSHPLALLNNRTVAAGEDAEVTTISGKVKVRCLEIKPTSIILLIKSQSEPLEIFLRKAAQ